MMGHSEAELAPWGYKRELIYKEYLMLLEKADMDQEVIIGHKRPRCEVDDEDDAFWPKESNKRFKS